MTNPTPHGQVPNKYLTVVYRDIAPGKEARELIEHPKMSASSWSHALNDRDAAIAQVSTLRTAHVQNPAEIEHDAGDVSKNGAGLNMSTQHTRIAELEAQIEALSGVQALSAAPAVPAGWKAVPVNPTPEMWKAAKSVPHQNPYGLVWDAMLAASPTPPAEQQAASSAVLKAIHEANMQLVRTGDDAFMLVPYKVATAEQQAAPKAAPGEPDPADIIAGALQISRGHAIEMMREACLGAAPQQEAQEPCPTCVALARTVMLDQVSFDRKPDCYGIRQITDDEGVEEWEDIRTSPDVAREEANDMMATGRGEIYEVVPLYTAPLPAPAPLSEMPYEKRKAIQEGEQIGASDAWFHARHNMLDTLDRRNVFRAGFDRGWNAALAAQGGE